MTWWRSLRRWLRESCDDNEWMRWWRAATRWLEDYKEDWNDVSSSSAFPPLGATSPPPLPCTALPRWLPVYVMTSDVYERRRRDLSPFYRHRSGVSFFPETASLRSAANQTSLRLDSEGKRRELGMASALTPQTWSSSPKLNFSPTVWANGGKRVTALLLLMLVKSDSGSSHWDWLHHDVC